MRNLETGRGWEDFTGGVCFAPTFVSVVDLRAGRWLNPSASRVGSVAISAIPDPLVNMKID